MKPNIVYLDFETSGLDPKRHAVLQAAWIVERDGEVLQERVFDVQPDRNDDLCMAALEINGFDFPRIKAGKYMSHILTIFKQDCLQVSSPRLCGHNVQFDVSFLKEAADRAHENLYLYLDFKKFLDTAAIARYHDYLGNLSLEEYKLTSCCAYFGIEHKAHDALDDIRATRELFHILTKQASYCLFKDKDDECKHAMRYSTVFSRPSNCVGFKKEGCPLGKI